MISYAQNFEDVMLARCFAKRENGFYVDVGAAHPISDSVTSHFYNQGWRGINIEPVTTYYNLLVQERPEDINLQIAVSAQEGEASFYEVKDTGLSTLIAEEANRATARGFEQVTRTITTKPLSAILSEAKVKDIHFMKIDVEGAEAVVLRSNDWRRFRPQIILVEATRPNEPTPAWDEWEPYLLSQNYVFVWFDGLNRFYVAQEHEEAMKSHFMVPPNVFDNFKRYSEMQAYHESDSWRNNYIDLLTRYASMQPVEYDQRILASFWPQGSKRKATNEDVHHAYHHILGREGDPAGLAEWLRLVEKGRISVDDIVKQFTQSPEYQQRRNLALKKKIS